MFWDKIQKGHKKMSKYKHKAVKDLSEQVEDHKKIDYKIQ